MYVVQKPSVHYAALWWGTLGVEEYAMMTLDYPPMDKATVEAMIAGMGDEGPPCPWGCEVVEDYLAAFTGEVANDWCRQGWRCPTCKRCWTEYTWFQDYHGGPYRMEILPGWPPDALPAVTGEGEGG